MYEYYIIITNLSLNAAKQHVKTWRNLVQKWILVEDEQKETSADSHQAIEQMRENVRGLPGILSFVFGLRQNSLNIHFKEEKGKTTIMVEGYEKTESTGESLHRYLSKHDASVLEPPQPSPLPEEESNENYIILIIFICVAALIILANQ